MMFPCPPFARRLPLALSLVFLLVTGARAEQVPEEKIRAARPAVARIITASGHGTGFFIRSDGLLATAFHVIAGANNATVHLPSGQACEVEGVVAVRPELDLALLKVRPERLPSVQPLIRVAEKPSLEAPVVTIGYPGNKEQTVTQGLLLHEENRAHSRPLPLDLKVQGGNSGGPLLNAEGEAVAVVVSTIGEEVAFAMDIGGILPLPPEGSRLTSLSEVNRSTEGSAWELYSQGLGVLGFWKERSQQDPSGTQNGIRLARTRFLAAAKKREGFLQALVNAAICSVLLEDYRAALQQFKDASKAAPSSIVARYFLAYALAASGEVKQAKRELRTVLGVSPSFSLARRALGSFHLSEREYSHAVHELRTALQRRPEDPEAHLHLGSALSGLKRYTEAVREYQTVIKLDPESYDGLLALGIAYARLKKGPQALSAMKSALRLRPNDPEVHHMLGILYVQLGQHAQARRAYTRLRELDPAAARKLKALMERRPKR